MGYLASAVEKAKDSNIDLASEAPTPITIDCPAAVPACLFWLAPCPALVDVPDDAATEAANDSPVAADVADPLADPSPPLPCSPTLDTVLDPAEEPAAAA